MGVHFIKKGLDLPISGAPEQALEAAPSVASVALLAEDYVGMKPAFSVKVGDTVKRGQLLFEDKKTPGVLYTAPGAGTVAAIHRGARRALQSVVITLSESEQAESQGDQVDFAQYQGADPASLDAEAVQALLLESGLWPSLRTRPYSKVPAPDSRPHSIFVTAMDTNPLAPSMEVMMEGREEDLAVGLMVLGKLSEGEVFFCKEADSKVAPPVSAAVKVEAFSGPHPAGLAGTHIHLLDPVSREKTVWYIGLQDLLAVGALFRTGRLDFGRIISLAGPGVKQPRMLRTRIGACVDEVVAGQLEEGEQRVISGSVLSGRMAAGEVLGYLGRYHQQVCAVAEDRERVFLGWMSPGKEKFSLINLFVSKFSKGKQFTFGTSTNGSPRAMVPIGMFEKVMPLDILPTFLLRSLLVSDIERAEQLGCLELDEEDLALCTFVCPGKVEYGPVLRKNLMTIEKEG